MVMLSMMIGGMLRCCFVVVVLVFVVGVVGGGGVCAVVNPVLNWASHSCVCSPYIRWW